MKITLCGSTRFMPSFHEWNLRLTKAGHLVYSVAAATTDADKDSNLNPEVKLVLDAVHIGKIEESDAIFVITCAHEVVDNGGTMAPYVGESTAREVYYAQLRGKLIVSDGGLKETLSISQMNNALAATPLKRSLPLAEIMRLPGRGS